MHRIATFLYGIACYTIFFATFLYAVGFVGNFIVPTTIDGTPTLPFGQALLIDLALLAVFAVQHSVMARPGFKALWTKIVPEHVERSTYVLFSSLALILLFWQWQPLGGVIWQIDNTIGRYVLYGLCAFGWLLVLASTFLINHFDLFGLRQVWLYFRGSSYEQPRFATPGLYKLVRHPLYVGFIFAFWATPDMTAAHLVFAVMTTVYILLAIQFEERDLIHYHGDAYRNYKRQVPMLIPRLLSRKHSTQQAATVNNSI